MIYKITCNITGNIYVGKTTKPLKDRLARHERDFNNYISRTDTKYMQSYHILKNGNYKIEAIDSAGIPDAERYFINMFPQSVNNYLSTKIKRRCKSCKKNMVSHILDDHFCMVREP